METREYGWPELAVVASGDIDIHTHTSFLTFGDLIPLIDGAEPEGDVEGTVETAVEVDMKL
jgi:hypothetical protein